MPDIMHLIKFNTPPAPVYCALTTAEGIRSWWTKNADLDSTVGGVGEFRFYGGDKITKVAIAELAPPTRVAWDVISSFRLEWRGTKISFDLRADGEDAELLFAHRGYPRADEDYALCTTGWGIYLGRLQQYLQIGQPCQE